MDCRKVTAQLLVDVACTLDYFIESCEIVPLTSGYIQVDHVLLLENGLSPPKIYIKIVDENASRTTIKIKQSQESLTDFSEEDASDCQAERFAPTVDTTTTTDMKTDISEIKKLLHTVLNESRQLKETCIDLHNTGQRKIDEIDRKVSVFSVEEENETIDEVVEECTEDSNFGTDSIDKSYEEVSSKQIEDHKFDLNSMSEFFPLTTHYEIIAFENRVRIDIDFKEKMVKTLYQVGGENARVACRKLSKLMFQDEILVEYSYEGAQSKKKFKEFTEIIEIIFLAVYNRFDDYTMEQHKGGLSDHLRYASSRLKKRKNAILSRLEGNSNSSKKSKFSEIVDADVL